MQPCDARLLILLKFKFRNEKEAFSARIGQFVQRLWTFGTAPPGMRIEGPVFVLQTSEQSPDIGPPYWN